MPEALTSTRSLIKTDKKDRYLKMLGKRSSDDRHYVIKRFNLSDIHITKEEKNIVIKALEENIRFIQIGTFTIVLTSIAGIELDEQIASEADWKNND